MSFVVRELPKATQDKDSIFRWSRRQEDVDPVGQSQTEGPTALRLRFAMTMPTGDQRSEERRARTSKSRRNRTWRLTDFGPTRFRHRSSRT